MKSFILFLCFIFSAYLHAASFVVLKDAKGHFISGRKIKKTIKNTQELGRFPRFLVEGPGGDISEVLFESLLPENQVTEVLQAQFSKKESWKGSEVRTLVHQGPIKNRINLTIVGDGYTLKEKEKFFDDAQRITSDLFEQKTFSSYLPLFNVYAVFVPSKDSGITDLEEKDTALGLYRSPRGSKRAIFPGKTQAIYRALNLAPATDYPILLANDDYYGGLGGEFAITTRSLGSGSMVLRHELGHNFGRVGEEYDGGSVYTGANHSSSRNVPWKQWIEGETQVFESHFLDGDYVWRNLEGAPYVSQFTFPEGPFYLKVKISSVGWATSDDVGVYLDGQRLLLPSPFLEDRNFHNMEISQITPGNHKIQARELIHDGDNVLAFIQLLAEPIDIVKSRFFVGGYSTFNYRGAKVGYRPTYNTCLMRDMKSEDFCPVDKENMWLHFLKRVDLVDKVVIQKAKNGFRVKVLTPALKKNLRFHWFYQQKGTKKKLFADRNLSQVLLTKKGQYELVVTFQSPEVRVKSENLKFVFPFQL